MATASSMIAEVANAVRGLVRDLIANLLGALVSYSIELAGTAGAAPHYLLRGPAMGLPASGTGMTVSPCRTHGPEGHRFRRH